jgi:hypothetical protein
MRTRDLVPVIVLAALIGACSRRLPSTFPSSSAASSEAAQAPAAVVGRALREDPPLPGEPTAGWEGLEPSDAATSTSHAHGAGHAH